MSGEIVVGAKELENGINSVSQKSIELNRKISVVGQNNFVEVRKNFFVGHKKADIWENVKKLADTSSDAFNSVGDILIQSNQNMIDLMKLVYQLGHLTTSQISIVEKLADDVTSNYISHTGQLNEHQRFTQELVKKTSQKLKQQKTEEDKIKTRLNSVEFNITSVEKKINSYIVDIENKVTELAEKELKNIVEYQKRQVEDLREELFAHLYNIQHNYNPETVNEVKEQVVVELDHNTPEAISVGSYEKYYPIAFLILFIIQGVIISILLT